MKAYWDRCSLTCLQTDPSNSGHRATKCISHDSEEQTTKGRLRNVYYLRKHWWKQKKVKANIHDYIATKICSSWLNVFLAEKTLYELFEIINVQINFFVIMELGSNQFHVTGPFL